jgi:hypothetical protein
MIDFSWLNILLKLLCTPSFLHKLSRHSFCSVSVLVDGMGLTDYGSERQVVPLESPGLGSFNIFVIHHSVYVKFFAIVHRSVQSNP